LPTFGCQGNAICSLKNSDSIVKFANLENPIVHVKKYIHILYRTKICANLAYFCQNLVAMATPFALLKIWIAYTSSRGPRKPYYPQERFPDFLHRTEISAILADFCLNLVAMAAAFDPLKIPIVYLNSPTLKTLYTTHAKTFSLFYTELKCVKFRLILPKFGCHGNVLCSLKTSDSIFEFYNPEKPRIYVKIVTISHTELKSVHFGFCLNLVAMATPFSPLKFLLAYLNSPTQKPTTLCLKKHPRCF